MLGEALVSRKGKGQFWGISGHTENHRKCPACGRYSQPYSVGAAAMRPFTVSTTAACSELSMGWVDPRVGLGWVGSGWVETFQFLVAWVGLVPLKQNY